MGRPLKIAKATLLNVTDTTTGTNEVTVSQTLADYGIIAGMPFVPTTTTGTNLVAGTTYWILKVTGASTFTVSATELSANPTSTPVALTTGTTASVLSVGIVDSGFNNPDNSNTAAPTGSNASFGVVGGNTGIYGKQTLVQVMIGINGTGTITTADDSDALTGVGTTFTTAMVGATVYAADGTELGVIDSVTNATAAVLDANALANTDGVGYYYATNEPGFILRQKGKTKYLVQGATTGLVGACWTANVANAALTPNTMNIMANTVTPTTVYVSSLNDYQSELFPAQVASGSLVTGTIYTIYTTGTTDWTTVGSASNMTGTTFKATGTAAGTGTAIAYNANPDVIATFGTAYAANTFPGENPITGQTSLVSGQPNPIVTINNA